MCDSCHCGETAEATIVIPGQPHGHQHQTRKIMVEHELLAQNDHQGEANRRFFAEQKILALNLVSSPGSGKTSILERTLKTLGPKIATSVIEGDQQTARDAERISAAGAPVVQVNTGAGCHLDAEMIRRALARLPPKPHSLLFIENVGNLVCPALFDLGEHAKVAIISVTEGEDKPQKYPHLFRAASLCLINKIDLLPHLDFDLELCKTLARQVNPRLTFLELSAKSGEGFAAWLQWLRDTFNASHSH